MEIGATRGFDRINRNFSSPGSSVLLDNSYRQLYLCVQGNDKRRFANICRDISDDDYTNPPEGSYFHHVIQKKEKLEKLYSQFVASGAGTDREKEVFKMLVGELLGNLARVERKEA